MSLGRGHISSWNTGNVQHPQQKVSASSGKAISGRKSQALQEHTRCLQCGHVRAAIKAVRKQGRIKYETWMRVQRDRENRGRAPDVGCQRGSCAGGGAVTRPDRDWEQLGSSSWEPGGARPRAGWAPLFPWHLAMFLMTLASFFSINPCVIS